MYEFPEAIHAIFGFVRMAAAIIQYDAIIGIHVPRQACAPQVRRVRCLKSAAASDASRSIDTFHRVTGDTVINNNN